MSECVSARAQRHTEGCMWLTIAQEYLQTVYASAVALSTYMNDLKYI